ncbi:MAG: cyclic nucleotide-binding domain-containing protein [Chloroflexi bacterium]|nr:MAG: cyclic nucleotide-binding domain-containing protein [Chloroflexota bacterium]
MSIPFRHDAAAPAAGDARPARAPDGRPRPSQIIRYLGVLEQAAALFALPDHALHRLARRARPVELASGATLVQRGTTGDSIYLIDRGACHVTAGDEGEAPARLAGLREGDMCGGSALLGEPSPVAVVAATDCRVLALDLTALRAVVPADDPVGAELRQQVANRETGYRALADRARRDAELPAGDAPIVALYSPRGGVGRTTIALNLAAQLAQGHPGQVLMVDLDLPYAPAALLAGLVPTDSLARASWSGSLGTSTELRDALTSAAMPHESGFLLLPATLRLAESELLTTEQVTTALQTVRGAFRDVVVDLGSSLGGFTLGVCDLARHLVMVVSPELQSLKGAREALELFRELHIPDDRITIVLNQRQADAAVPRESVERALGIAPAVDVRPDGGRADRAALAGTMLVTSTPKSEIARAARQLADIVEGARNRKEED